MALERFGIASLATIDNGRVREGFEQAFERLEQDCRDRSGIEKPRTLVLTVNVVPLCDPSGKLESCNVDFQITEKLPERRSKVYNMATLRDGGLLFNELSPEEARQRTLDEMDLARRTEEDAKASSGRGPTGVVNAG